MAKSKEEPEKIVERGLIDRNIATEMRDSYLDYAMSVITGRALPDVRDGFKPVHRRILFAMNEMGLFSSARQRKSAAIVGDVLGKYHPHGDTAVYDAMVKMAQQFTYRYPLILGQGNFGCFTKDTKVRLADGRNLSFEELIKEDENGKTNYTFTVNKNGDIEIAKIIKPRLTKRNAEIMKVFLDNGEEIKCTLNHKFMLKDGTYREAQDLKEGLSLMPIYRRQSDKDDVKIKEMFGYEMVFNPKDSKWAFVHHLADKYNIKNKRYSIKDGRVRHHIDFSKLNNSPENIKRMQWKDHFKLHSDMAGERHNDLEYVKKIAEGRNKFWSNEENKKKYSERIALRNQENWGKTEYRERMRKMLSDATKRYTQEHPEKREELSKLATKTLTRLWKNSEYREAMRRNIIKGNKNHTTNTTGKTKFDAICAHILAEGENLSENVYEKTRPRLYSYGKATLWNTGLNKYYGGDVERVLAEVGGNHKVRSVEFFRRYEDVYDLTVQETHNFSLAAGVFVHNSIDGDSAAAMRYCVTRDTLIPTERGLLPISKISEFEDENISTRVLSLKGEINTASKWFDSGEHQTLSLKTNRGYSLSGSYNHPVLTWSEDVLTGEPRFEWKLLSSVQEGDVLVLDRTSDTLWPSSYLDLTKYSPAFNSKKVITKQLPTHLTEDLAFILGLLVSEGTIKEKEIEFCNSDLELIESFKIRWQKTFPDCRLHFFTRKPTSYGKKPYYTIEIHSQYVIRFLRLIGLEPLRSKNKNIPFSVLESPKSVVANFIQAYFEGDGSISFSSKMTELSAISKSKTLLNQLQIVMLRFGIASTRRYDKYREIDKLYIRGLGEYRTFEREIGFFSSRKKEKLQNAIERLHKEYSKTDFVPFISAYARSVLSNLYGGGRQFALRHNFDRYSNLDKYGDTVVSAVIPTKRAEVRELFRELSSNLYLFDVVTEVKKAGVQKVYSLRVDSECHSFVGNGFINHNTEAKMSKLSSELLRDLDKETVSFRPNYDSTRKEPTVLPAAVPNLLLNGTLGIAVGMASDIPPHNLREVVSATVHLIDNSEATTEDLLQFVKGPDFPMGGIAYNEKDIHHAYSYGRGGVVVRGEAEIAETKGGQSQIIITSIPFRVNKSNLIVAIADLVRDKKLEGIKGLRDESTRDIRVVIDLKQGVQPQKVLNYVYKHTQLEDTFHFNCVALVDGVPETLSLKAMLEEFIKHRKLVVRRRTEFDLKQAEAREHILIGLSKALDHIDEVIKLIKKSKDVEAARLGLMKEFRFSELQANAILDMRLQKLAGLERKKIEDELKEIQALIKMLKDLLGSPKKILGVIKDELRDIADKYGDERRTKIVKHAVKALSDEDMVPDTESMLVYTQGGYVKRTNPDEYRKQRRGGVGVMDLDTKEEDFITQFLTTSSHSDLLFFTDKGKVYQMKMYELPEGRRATRGKSIMNYLSLSPDEKISSILPMPKSVKQGEAALMMVTRNGIGKKMAAKNFHDVRRSGIIAIKLDKDDALISAFFVGKGDTAMVGSSYGQSIRFKESDVREMGRTAGGVKVMKLKKGDMIVAAEVARKEHAAPELLVISANGYGKRTSLKEYKIQKRGGSGIKTAKVTSKTGQVITGKVVFDPESEVVAISKKSQVIRVDLKEIPTLSRATQGVRVMKLHDGDSIASIVCL